MTCSKLPCNTRIGIIGAGQLGLMLFQQGIRMGFKFNVLGREDEPLCKYTYCFNPERYEEFVDQSDIVTYEFEHAIGEAMEYADKNRKLRPNLFSVKLKREREKELVYLKKIGAPLPEFEVASDGKEALELVASRFNGKAVIKKSVGGYDGKGQYFVRKDIEKYKFLENDNSRFVVVEYVDFDYEASIIAASNGKDFAFFPPSYNLNRKGILILNYGSIKLPDATGIAKNIMRSLEYTGTIGIELFVRKGQTLINEISPRVHNSGHYTLDACNHSQFELHLKAIAGMELNEPKCSEYFGMVNILGLSQVNQELDSIGKIFMYSKEGNTPRRKVGHINFTGKSLEDVKLKSAFLVNQLYGSLEDLENKL